MRVERIIKGIKTLGPGNRIVIWTNGCHKRCSGCVSERLQKIEESTEIDIIKTLDEFSLKDIDGVTISGGEPFIQITELLNVVNYFLSKNIEDILVYTGYTIEELLKLNDPNVNYILENIAVLIDGEYVKELDDNSSNIKGSSNQKVIFLKKQFENKYASYIKNTRIMETYFIKNLKIGVGIPSIEYIKKF